jgi:hypothetical protein
MDKEPQALEKHDHVSVEADGDVQKSSANPTDGHPTKLHGWVRYVLFSIETRGIQRVTEEERQQNTTKVWNACTFW